MKLPTSFFTPTAVVWFLFALIAPAHALTPTPDGCYPGFTTAEGCGALSALTTGSGNSAFGWRSLFFDSFGSFNTGVGAGALALNNGNSNTATGAAALLLNANSGRNTAMGTDALVFTGMGVVMGDLFNNGFGAFSLFNNIDGFSNDAFGDSALLQNFHAVSNTAFGDLALSSNDVTAASAANFNTAFGAEALFSNTDGSSNNAVGVQALSDNTTGLSNQGMGFGALGSNVDGSSNVGVGDSAMTGNVHGSSNTMIGDMVAPDLTDGSDNIYIGATAGSGVSSENGTIRIGDPSVVTTCFISGISGVQETGDPVLVDANGQLGIGMAASPMSANELLKQHRVVQALKVATQLQQVSVARHEQELETVAATLREQAEQIQKVSAEVETLTATPRLVEHR